MRRRGPQRAASRHTRFFVPMRYWAYVLVGGGVIAVVNAISGHL